MTKKTRYFLAGSAAVMVAGLCTGLVAYYTGGFQPIAASAVANELRYVPADVTVVAYADVRSVMDSELRMRLKQVMPGHEQGQQEFQQHTGIDIERDIDYVVAAGSPGVGNGSPVVIARGRFNDTQLEGLIREHGGNVENYRGKRLVVGGGQNFGGASTQIDAQVDTAPMEVRKEFKAHGVALAFLEPGLIAIGEPASVKKSIDAQMSAASITGNNEMMELVSDIGQGNNAWAVGRFDAIAQQARLHSQLPAQAAAQLSLVKWFAAAGHINGGVSGTLRAEARDEKAAEELRKGVDGLMAFARLAGQSDPKANALIQSLQLSGSGKAIVLSFTVPSELLDMAIPKQPAPPAPVPPPAPQAPKQ
jgi:hypothetical protein